jgi:ubiquinone/menaquinone biosynthesis C-methylase UbiE
VKRRKVRLTKKKDIIKIESPQKASWTKKLILKALNIQIGQTILDAGCGNGYMSKIFSKEVTESGKVYALDPDTKYIRALKKETQGTNIEVIKGDITKPTQINQQSVDIIYLSAVIHRFSKQQMQGFLVEAKRLLKPNSVLAIVEIEKKETPFGPPLSMRLSPKELKDKVPLALLNTIQVGEHFYIQIFKNKNTEAFVHVQLGYSNERR